MYRVQLSGELTSKQASKANQGVLGSGSPLISRFGESIAIGGRLRRLQLITRYACDLETGCGLMPA
ncbi:hypothetical protein L284_08625 [Novosphingobium lindaniclasticum LE124]|uniref:Uncharacterized protein n=1 Tax=Novosphingobium lindaniclasticum LE124 TaxID=1096930 RepID=T0HLZ7_9SPHN|nr:hypothetical protein L284_08625 [Novosphingobium lindaniclasticum LE124]